MSRYNLTRDVRQTVLLVGRAIQLGYLTMADLNKPLVHFMKELDSTQFVDGEELLPTEYLAKATSAITQASDDWQGPETYFYGYFW